MRRYLAIAGLVIGISGLAIQFAVSVPAYMAVGRSFPGAVGSILGFFTILTNIGVVLAYAAAHSGRPAFFARPGVRGGLAMAIVVVGIVYHFVLAQLWRPDGAFLVADTILHYVTPPFYLLWWALAGRDGSTRVRHLPYWLIYPFAYLGYALARGSLTGIYAYPFLDLAANGAAAVAISVGIIVALFAAIGLAVILADRILPSPHGTRPT